MCLFTFQKHPIIAQEDIIVYKKCHISGGKLMAFHRFNYHYAKKERVKLGSPKPHYWVEGELEIHRGLHANVMRISNHNTKWIIPKGSKIYYSSYGNEIVSNRMDFVEFVGVDSSWKNERPNFGIAWRKNFMERLIRGFIDDIF